MLVESFDVMSYGCEEYDPGSAKDADLAATGCHVVTGAFFTDDEEAVAHVARNLHRIGHGDAARAFRVDRPRRFIGRSIVPRVRQRGVTRARRSSPARRRSRSCARSGDSPSGSSDGPGDLASPPQKENLHLRPLGRLALPSRGADLYVNRGRVPGCHTREESGS